MLIVCPSCASSYSLTAEQLGSGRKLKCAACRHQWVATPADALPEPGDEPVPVVDISPPPAAPETPMIAAEVRSSLDDDPLPSPAEPAAGARGKAAKPSRTKRGKGPRVPLRARIAAATAAIRRLPAVAVAGVVLVILAGVAVAERKPIVRQLPQTARLFAAIGLPVNLRGLEIQGVRTELVADGGQTILVVEGTVRAVAPGSTDVPALQLAIRGADGQEVYAWTAEATATSLKIGETAPFRARLVAPPAEGQDVVIRFAGRDSQAPH